MPGFLDIFVWVAVGFGLIAVLAAMGPSIGSALKLLNSPVKVFAFLLVLVALFAFFGGVS
jgi:hypothetical protein